jgi:hypothetical protein
MSLIFFLNIDKQCYILSLFCYKITIAAFETPLKQQIDYVAHIMLNVSDEIHLLARSFSSQKCFAMIAISVLAIFAISRVKGCIFSADMRERNNSR